MNKEEKKKEAAGANRDLLTGAAGSHPVGSGVGATGGGVAGAAVGAVAGPVGAVVGAVAGAVAGGLAGKGIAEHVDPTVEDAYWMEHFSERKYVDPGTDYTIYQPAFRIGYEGRRQYAGKRFEEVETKLREEYEKIEHKAKVSWDKAQLAARDAWNRVEQSLPDEDDDGS
jgi:hypothetical protein